MVDKIIKWGIIGCGDVTEIKSGPAFNKVDGFELHAVMRRDVAKAEDYARRHQVPKYYGDADALINDPDIDAVYIATPPDSHEYYGLKVAQAAKPCCIEKPMAPTHAECARIVEAFENKEIPLFVAYYRRSLPHFEKVRELLEKSKIGKIRHLNWLLCYPPSSMDLSDENNWRTEAEIAYAGYFDDLASHGIDLFVHYLGAIKDAQGYSLNQQGNYTAHDAVSGSWIHESGVTGAGIWNFGSSRAEDRVEIHGSNGVIKFSIFENNPIVLQTQGKEEIYKIPHPENIQLPHIQKMKDHLSGRKNHPSTGASGAHTAWVLDKILGKI